MNRDKFLDTLRNHYSEEISFTYAKHEHGAGTRIDFEQLNFELAWLRRIAEVEGLPGIEFDDLVNSHLHHVSAHLNYNRVNKAA